MVRNHPTLHTGRIQVNLVSISHSSAPNRIIKAVEEKSRIRHIFASESCGNDEFGIVKMNAMMEEEVHKSPRRRALISGYPIPIKTCWVLSGHENHRNVSRQQRSSRAPSVRQFPSHVFREQSSLVFLIIISIFSSYLIRPGNGLHPPQCQWSLYQDIERLNCLVETGNSLIVEEEVHGIGPEHAKSLWVQCSSTSDMPTSTSSGSSSSNSANVNNNNNNGRSDFPQNGDSNYYSPSSSALGTEGVQLSSSQTSNNANAGGFVLSHGVFMAVPNLRDLRLDNCKISGITPGALSYLPYLQNLTVRAHTSLTIWPSSSLEIKTGVFTSLPELKHLDLSTTSLESLPNEFLCFLPSLQFLNLSSCGLRDFTSIGIAPVDPTNPQNCANELGVLDLSLNHLTLLPPAIFAAVSHLVELKIERNSITMASERALLGLNRLKKISISGNKLTSLPPEFFKDNRNLMEIFLDNNSLSILGPGIFAGLKHLVILDLSNNELTSEWVNGDTFRGLDSLYSLSLQYNFLTKLSKFPNLPFLQLLNLEHNNINHIAEDAFSGLPNIYTLILSHNHLKKIDSSICNGPLTYLSIDNNKIEIVEPDSFKNCSGLLMDINLSGNKLKEVPTALQNLTLLKTVDLGENLIDQLESPRLGLPNLYGLRLTGNKITNVSKTVFENLPLLKIVNLARNQIHTVEKGSFDNNPNLQAIRLDSNNLTDISGLFKNIPNLLWLNISENQLEDLKYEEFPNVQWLDVASNNIHTLGNCMELENLKIRIRNLDLSNNYITEISNSNLPDSLQILIIKSNRLKYVHPYTFYRKNAVTRVDLRHNQLNNLDQNALRIGPDRATSNAAAPEILLGDNPLQCDCSMEWLQSMENSGHYPIIQDIQDVKCTLSFDRQNEPISFLSVQPSQFLCKYESNCFKTCECCDFENCDCNMICAKNCTCYHDQAWSTNLVDCSMLEQNFIPSRIPMDVTSLRLDGNLFTSLDSHSFLGRKNLKILFLNASNIEEIQNRTFHGLKALKVLHLHNNFIERLEGHEFEGLEENLEELYLQKNSISWIANDTFSSLYRLRVLWLHGNNLVDVAIWDVTTRIGRLGHTLSDITLRGNEWSCECQFATHLKEFLIENRAKISDASQVHCVDQVSSSSSSSSASNNAALQSVDQNRSQTELVVVRLLDQKNHRCSQSTDLSILEPTKSTEPDEFNFAEYVPWLVCIPGVLLLVILIFLLSYYWRHSLRVWFHAHCGLRLGSCREPPAERDKLFDAFVSYSSKDEAWVRQVLAAELERNDPPYRLCLRYRDLPTGGTYLADTIVQASEASRRTILVLSHHFLKGEWSRTDVKSAHHSVLKDRHRKVIIILLGDLPSKDLDPDIRLYLKNHTYLNCDDKKFWEKLRYALPDVKVKVPVFRGIHGRTSSRNNSQHRSTGPPLQSHQQHLHHHHHHPQPSPNLSQAHHLTHLGPNTQNNISSPLIGPPPPLTAPPVPGLLANLPPNIPNGSLGPAGMHHGGGMHHGMGGPVTTVIGHGIGNTINSNNSGSQRAPQRHPSIVNSANPNSRQNTAIHI